MSNVKEKIKGIKYELSFEIPVALFDEKLNSQVVEFAKNHEEKGFRKGHMPLDVVRSKYEGSFINDTINDLINESIMNYCKEKNINPAAAPKIKLDSFIRGEDLKFSAEFEKIPSVDNIDLSKITLEKKMAKPSDKEINEAIENIAKSRHVLEEIKESRKTKAGDTVVIDFIGSVDGVEFEGGKGEKHPLELGSNSFIPGFEDQLIGKAKGDDANVNVEFPKDYGHEKLAGKKALFKVKIHEIKEKKTPVIDDAFAVELKRKDLADLKTYVSELLGQNYENSAKTLMKDILLDKLSGEKVELPESLVEQEVEYMFNSFKSSNPSMDEKAEKKKREELKKQAESRVKLGLILADFGNKEKIEISENDIQQAVMNEAMRYPQQAGQVFEYYSKNQNAREALRAGIFEEKVLDIMLSKVKVKEVNVSVDELLKQKK